jgi:hypothetical protein
MHVQALRSYVAEAETAMEWKYPYAREVLELSERVAAYLAAARSNVKASPVALLRKRDVQLLTVIGRRLIDEATPLLDTRTDANFRLSMGQSLLDVRDALRGALIGDGTLPERRAGGR